MRSGLPPMETSCKTTSMPLSLIIFSPRTPSSPSPSKSPATQGRSLLANEPKKRSADPFELLAAMDDRDRLVKAMTQLPERLQLVLQLFFVEELNLTEISQLLDVSVPRVHQLRSQALGKLKQLLEAE